MKSIPFFANTADDTHCVQAAFKMMLKYFLPERDFSWAELDKMTHKSPGKGTWWFPMAAKLEKLGLKTQIIEYFDYKTYFDKGNSYLSSIFSDEVVDYFVSKSNLTDVKHLIPNFLEKTSPELRPASIDDLNSLLDDNWLVIIDVNSRVLNNRPGYSGHVVLVYNRVGQNYLLHDPGLPAKKAQIVSQKLLLKAWQYTGINNTALFAVRG